MKKVKRPVAIFLALLLLGCVQRQMTVLTNPPGAVVYLNDREMGRTPFTKDFLWYGNYDVVIRKEGFATLKTTAEVTAPIWQFFSAGLGHRLLATERQRDNFVQPETSRPR